MLTVMVIGLLAAMSPGPDFLIVTRNSLLYSKRAGLYTALGITLGTVWWITTSLIGISLIISRTVMLFNAVKLLGAVYLIYIGLRSFRPRKRSISSGVPSPIIKAERKDIGPLGAFRIGLFTNLLNPKAALFFVSFFSIVITPATPALIRSAYGLEIALIVLIWFSLLATVLSISKVKCVFERFSLWFERATGALLILLGLKLAMARSK